MFYHENNMSFTQPTVDAREEHDSNIDEQDVKLTLYNIISSIAGKTRTNVLQQTIEIEMFNSNYILDLSFISEDVARSCTNSGIFI